MPLQHETNDVEDMDAHGEAEDAEDAHEPMDTHC